MRRPALTIIECLLATTLLAVTMMALLYTVVAGQQHVHHGDLTHQAVRLADDLLEEIVSRPYAAAQTPDPSDRTTLNLPDFDGYAESAGQLADFSGYLYPPDRQRFSRSVSVSPVVLAIADLDTACPGFNVTVTIEHTAGDTWRFERFVPEPPHEGVQP